MIVQKHFIYGAILSLLLAPFFKWYSLIIFAASFLFDIDHYFVYIYLKKDLNPFNAYKFFMKAHHNRSLIVKQKLHRHLYVFHTIEFLLFFAILSIFSKIVSIAFIGIMFHTFLDCFNHINKMQISIISCLLKKR